jgi:hypothetical protein
VPVGTKPAMGGAASNGSFLCVLEPHDGPPAAAAVEASRVGGPRLLRVAARAKCVFVWLVADDRC